LEVRQRVERRTGIPSDHVMVTATHAHSTPETIGFRSLLNRQGPPNGSNNLPTVWRRLWRRPNQTLAPMQLRTVKGRIDGMAASRRPLGKDGKAHMRWSQPRPEEIADVGMNDPEATVLCFQTEAGAPELVMIHFACHPVAVQAQPLISADFPGVVTNRIQAAEIGCRHCFYLQGAAGDINPVRDTKGFEDVEYHGRLLAQAVMGLIEQTTTKEQPAAPQNRPCRRDTVLLPSRTFQPWLLWSASYPNGEIWQQMPPPAAERAMAEANLLGLSEVMERVKQSSPFYEAEVHAFRIGDIALVGIPGEPFVDFGLQLKRGSAAPTTLCLAIRTATWGISPCFGLAQGGYEVSLGMWSVVGRNPSACS